MSRKHFLQLASFLLAACGLAFGQSRPSDQAPGQLLAKPRRGAEGAAAGAIRGHGAFVAGAISSLGVQVLRVPEAAADGIARSLQASGHFEYVEPDYYGQGTATPNDPDYAYQWHLPKISAPLAWDLTQGTAAVIALVDSGIDSLHTDLAGKILPGWNFLSGNTNTSDVLGHGTITGGAAAAATNNFAGIAGAGWNAVLMPLVVLNSSNYATYSNIASAITYATDRGVRVISISIAGSSYSFTLQNAVNYAWNKGAVVVAAAGNKNSTSPMYPAACTYAIAVGSTGQTDAKSSFSNYGSWIDLTAPGESILTTLRGGGYGYRSGTSLSTPIVAAVAALVLNRNPGLSATQLASLLNSTADDLGTAGFDAYFGWGRVNAYKAVSAADNQSSGGETKASSPTTKSGNGKK